MGKPEEDSIYFYKPNLGAAVFFAVLYFVPAVILWFRVIKLRTWYLLCLPLGATAEVAGYALKSYSTQAVTQVGPYAASSTLIVIAPLFIAVINYLTLGRLLLAVIPTRNQTLLGLGPIWLTRIFITADILSFLVQGSGSGQAAGDDFKPGSPGVYVLIGGLSLQLLTNFLFMFLVARFWLKVRNVGTRNNAPVGWNSIAAAVAISITLIFVRSVYRVIEFAIGVDGYLFNHEWVFYVFESLPMFPAIAVFVWWFPGSYLPKNKRHFVESDGVQEDKGSPASYDNRV